MISPASATTSVAARQNTVRDCEQENDLHHDAERHPVRVEVHVVPSQSEELCASRASESSEEQEGVHRLVAFADMVEKVAQFVRSRRTELGTGGDDSVGAFDGVVPRPAPPHRLSERRRSTTWTRAIVPADSG
jgi:hypothetical protein